MGHLRGQNTSLSMVAACLMLVSCLAYSSTLNTGVNYSSEMSADIQMATWRFPQLFMNVDIGTSPSIQEYWFSPIYQKKKYNMIITFLEGPHAMVHNMSEQVFSQHGSFISRRPHGCKGCCCRYCQLNKLFLNSQFYQLAGAHLRWYTALPPALFFPCGGVRQSLLGTSATLWPILPAPDDRWWVWNSRWKENLQGKPKYLEKACPSATLLTTYPTWLDLGSNPGCSCG
jgi:hypothetical protein